MGEVAPSPIVLPIPGWDALTRSAHLEGHRFVERMRLEWESGVNRFDRRGEILLGMHASGALIAFGGINIDPYTDDPSVARLRHIYVAPSCRRNGLARTLVTALIAHARPGFSRVRLRTSNPEADIFYRDIGFSRIEEPYATHNFHL